MKKEEEYREAIEKRVCAFIREQGMLERGDTVLLGVSGGADSVCLLQIMHRLSAELGILPVVAHINHGVRKEAGRDAAYVRALCEERGISFFLKEVDMNALAAERHLSPEEAGREARYGFFGEVMELVGAQRTAIAHNMGDCSETVLFHLFRGSGLRGLTGIRPVRDRIIRPLLCLERREIERYLQCWGLSHCHDRTNDEDAYTRNRIRHHIMAYAESEIVSGASRNIYYAAQQLAQVKDFVEQQTMAVRERVVLLQEEKRTELSVTELGALHPVLQKEILRQEVLRLTQSARDITREHMESIVSLLQGQRGRHICLPYGLRAERSYDKLLLYIGEADMGACREESIGLAELLQAPVTVKFGSSTIELFMSSYEGNLKDIPQNQYTKWFDYDKIKDNLKIRTRRNGDYFTVKKQEGLGHKKLKDYLMDEKIPRELREQLPLVAEGGHVLWLMPYRISEYYKVDAQTKRILQIKYTE